METVLIKRNVAEYGLPRVDKIKHFITNVGHDVAYNPASGNWFVGRTIRRVDWYLEEISLSKLIEDSMPSEGQKHDKFKELSNSGLNLFGFWKQYDEWLKTKLTNKK